MSASQETPGPVYNFTTPPSVASYAVPCKTYLATHAAAGSTYHGIASGALVLSRTAPPRILLIQRAAHDSMPHRWETPGGAVDAEDATILHGVARELWEEAGLAAARVGPAVESYRFRTGGGRWILKCNFVVEAALSPGGGALEARVDPKEHQDYVWATEEEVRTRKAVREGKGETELRFTSKEQEMIVLEAFEVKREEDRAAGQANAT